MKRLILMLVLLFSKTVFSQQHKAVMNIDFDLVFKDKKGNDLLNPATAKAYNKDKIALYYIENGIKVKIDKPGMDYPNNHFIYKEGGMKYNHLRVFLDKEVILLQLSETQTDTIKCIIGRQIGITRVEKVSYNGVLKWKEGKNKSTLIEIKKD